MSLRANEYRILPAATVGLYLTGDCGAKSIL